MTSRQALLSVVVLLVFLGSSISVTSAVGQASTTTLDPTLEQLVEADDPAAYAETHGLAYRNESVRVIIELGPNATIPDEYEIDIEQEYRGPQQTLVQAFVPLQQLRPLAADPAVDYIRPPERGVADSTTEPQPAPTPADTATQTPVTDTGQQQWFSSWILIILVVPLAALILIMRLKKGEH